MQNIVAYFEQANAFIEKCRAVRGKILVHCFAGKSRASTITLSYMMKHGGLDLRTALNHLQRQRPIAQPNIGFIVQLKSYEKSIFGQCSDVPILQPAGPQTKDTPQGPSENKSLS